mgnify:CR=1 FL=1
MQKPIVKSYFDNIFFESLIHKKPSDAIIIFPGFPSSNKQDDIINFLYNKGFNVFFPSYGI